MGATHNDANLCTEMDWQSLYQSKHLIIGQSCKYQNREPIFALFDPFRCVAMLA